MEASEKFIDEFARTLQLYQGNMDPEAVRMYEQAQAGYNRNLELQSELQKMMETLQSNRDYSAQAEEIEQSGRQLYETDIDAARAFADEAMDLMDKHNKECAAIMTIEWVPENRNGEIYMVPKYTYSAVIEGEHNNVIEIALKGLLIQTDGSKYLLHSHPDGEYSDGRVELTDVFSGAPNNILDPGDANIPTVAGSDWFEAPNILNSLPIPLYQIIKNAVGLSISGYDGIYLAAPTGYLYYYEGIGTGFYQTSNKDDFRNDKKNFEKANDFPKTTGSWNVDTGVFTPYK
jgi:hypothetical protein